MIELYAKLTRSADEILSLMNAPITFNSFVNQGPINSTEPIIYYGGVIQRATIIESNWLRSNLHISILKECQPHMIALLINYFTTYHKY